METRQEMYDKAVRHLRGMRQRSMQHNECRYRGENGARCVIGARIPDKLYKPEFEGIGVRLAVDIQQAAGIPQHLLQFACYLQSLHDTDTNWCRNGFSEEALQRFAALERVLYTPPT